MSDPSTSTVIAETIYAYQETRKENTINVVAATLLAYDALLCIGKELRYVWQSPNTPPTFSQILYLSNRYIPILWNVLYLGAIGKLSDTQSCTPLHWLVGVVGVLAALGPASFVTLRVYALSERNKISTGVVLLLITSAVVVGSATLYQNPIVRLPLPYGCLDGVVTNTTTYIAWVIASRTCIILADIMAIVVTWRCTRTARQTSTHLQRPSLQQILWENGNIYFCTMISLNIADMAIALSSATHATEATDIISFVEPISSILNSRFLLALYKTNTIIRKGGTSTQSLSSLDFGGADRSGPPELPEFLTSLAGPIYSMADHDTDLLYSSTAPQIESEAEAEGSWLKGGGSDDTRLAHN